ncbi:hypothetical protein BH20CHL4_BH20CHL4_01990 [soil metagenome]
MKFFLRPLMVALTLVLLAGGSMLAPIPVAAQDGEVAVSQASPETGGEAPVEPAATGVLRVVALECALGEGEGFLALLLESEFVPDGSCVESIAGIFVDGVDFGPASPALELELDAGIHSVAEANTGMSRDIDVFADAVSTMWVVNFTAVALAEEPVTDSMTLSLVVHICEPGIISADSLLALGGRYGRLAKCPAITLPGEYAPGGTVTAGQDWFDFVVQDASGFSAAMSDAVFVPDAVCESGLGVEITASPYDDACYSTSSYDLTVPATSLSVATSGIPASHRFGYAEADDPAAESAVIVTDSSTGAFTVDAGSGYGDPLKVHVYFLSPPQLTIVQHLCGEDIGTPGELDALGGFVPRALACPAVTRSVDGGALDFDASVADGAAVTHALGGAALETWSVCEFELGFDYNGDPNDNACLDMPAYRLMNVTRGLVEVWQAFGPADVKFGGLDFVPGTGDGGTFLDSDPANAMVSLDTSNDGDVVIHLYALSASDEPDEPDEPEAAETPVPTATSTPVEPEVGTGAVQVAVLYCLGSRTVTTLTALAPGELATAAEMGGDCFGGDGQVQITLASGETQPAFRLGRQGLQWIDGLPVSGGSNGSHLLTDQVSNQSVAFDIEPGAVTRVILRVEVAFGTSSDTGPATTETDDTPETATSPNPLDFLSGLVTDVLVTDELSGIPHAGTSYEGSFDSNSFVVDLLSGLQTDELASVTAEGMPVVGVRSGQRDGLFSIYAMVAAGALAAGLCGWWWRRRHALA